MICRIWVQSLVMSFKTISQYVALVTAASAPVSPPIAILGLSYFFVTWVSNAVLDNMLAFLPVIYSGKVRFDKRAPHRPSVELLIMA